MTFSNLFPIKLDKKSTNRLILMATHIGSLIPLLVLYYDYYFYRLGADEINEATLRTGKTAIILIFLSLAVTPLNTLFNWKWLIPTRKWFGVYGFVYVCVHLAIFAFIDYQLNPQLLLDGIVNNPYVVVGFTAFLFLIPLAATSTQWAQRKLGKKWKQLHRLVYLIGILVVIHFLWLRKDDFEPTIYAVILTVLLLLRVTPIKQKVLGWRRQIERQMKTRRALKEVKV